jgi:hypothetical protein
MNLSKDIPKVSKTKKLETIDLAVSVEKSICSVLSPVEVYVGGVLWHIKNQSAYRYSNQSDIEHPSMDSDYLLNWSHDDQGPCLLLFKKGTHDILKEFDGEARGCIFQNRLLIQEGSNVILYSLPDLDQLWSLPVQGSPFLSLNESVCLLATQTLSIVNEDGVIAQEIPLGYEPDWVLLRQDQLLVVHDNQIAVYSSKGELLTQTSFDFIPTGYHLRNIQTQNHLLGLSCKRDMVSMLLVFDLNTLKWFRFEEKRKAIRSWDHYVWFVKRHEAGLDAQLWLQNHYTR